MIEQWQIHLNHQKRMVILLLKKHLNRDKCNSVTKQRMFGVFAIEEAPSPLRTLSATLACKRKYSPMHCNVVQLTWFVNC